MMRQFLLKLTLAIWPLWLLAPIAAANDSSTVAHDSTPAIDEIDEGAPVESDVRPQDSVWIISTRHLCCPGPDNVTDPDVQVSRYDWNGGWIDTTLDEFFATPADFTVFFIHGNRANWGWSQTLGWEAYYGILPTADPTTSIKFVIWSWPADQIRGPCRDVRAKAARADTEAVYLSRVLSRFPADERLGLLAFSFGARAVTGALHLLAGGSLCCYSLPPDVVATAVRPRVVLLTPGMHNYWLRPCGWHGLAISQSDHMLIQYNSCDNAMRYYPIAFPHGRPQALGYTGFYWTHELGPDAERFSQLDACGYAGREHATRNFLGNSYLMGEAAWHLLWLPVAQDVPVAAEN